MINKVKSSIMKWVIMSKFRTDFYSDLSNVSPTDFTSEGSLADSKYISFVPVTVDPLISFSTFL